MVTADPSNYKGPFFLILVQCRCKLHRAQSQAYVSSLHKFTWGAPILTIKSLNNTRITTPTVPLLAIIRAPPTVLLQGVPTHLQRLQHGRGDPPSILLFKKDSPVFLLFTLDHLLLSGNVHFQKKTIHVYTEYTISVCGMFSYFYSNDCNPFCTHTLEYVYNAPITRIIIN